MKWAAWLAKRKPSVRERILRLNPVHRPGEILRGYHPRRRGFYTKNIGKRDFIREHGRAAWAALPRVCIQHDGHRKFVSFENERDCLWLAPAGDPIRFARRRGKGWNEQIIMPEWAAEYYSKRRPQWPTTA